jgi:hypothetical protein
MNLTGKQILGWGGSAVGVIALVITLFSTMGINNAGYRTVIQGVGGDMSVKYNAGIYFPMFGKTTEYPDYLTYDFSPLDGSCDFEQNDGIKLRYQDGGEGIVCGMANVMLPPAGDEKGMIAFHKRYRSESGARVKLLNQTFPKVLNLTAGLMTSTEAYATKRSQFISMGKDQVENGLFQTVMVERNVQVGVDSEGNPEMQLKEVPEIVEVKGIIQYEDSDLEKWGVSLSQFDLKAWDFEPKTLDQIRLKRAAEMASVTAKANANKAYWQEQEAVANGAKNAATAKATAITAAQPMIENAKRDKQLAIIEAEKIKERAIELTLAATEEEKRQKALALAAVQEAKVIKTIANAEAHRKKVLVEADGALQLRLEAAKVMNRDAWAAIAKQKWTPEIVLGGSSGGELNEVSAMVQTQLINNLKAIGVNPHIPK